MIEAIALAVLRHVGGRDRRQAKAGVIHQQVGDPLLVAFKRPLVDDGQGAVLDGRPDITLAVFVHAA